MPRLTAPLWEAAGPRRHYGKPAECAVSLKCMATESKLPYLTSYGNIEKALTKIKTAATPSVFSQDFLGEKLGMTGGSSRPILPFLKRTGFLAQDGTPTALYKEFRNPDKSGGAAAKALRTGYAVLYEMDEEVHKRDAKELKNLVVQATGFDADSPTARAIVKSFEALKGFAKFSAPSIRDEAPEDEDQGGEGQGADDDALQLQRGFNLGYTINLNLPATSDVGVYNAIFRSLRENLLRDLG
jgi:Family of unknown function (DUF5343)